MIRTSLIYILFVFSFAGCGAEDDDDETIVVTAELKIPFKVICREDKLNLCIEAVINNEQTPTHIYSSINGFEFIWGNTYVLSLRVNRNEEEQFRTYELVDLVSQENKGLTTITYPPIELVGNIFYKDSEKYFFLGKEFLCEPLLNSDVVEEYCNGLINLNDSGGLVNVSFAISEFQNFSLHEWN